MLFSNQRASRFCSRFLHVYPLICWMYYCGCRNGGRSECLGNQPGIESNLIMMESEWMQLVALVYLVGLVGLVCLVCLVCLVEQDQLDGLNKPDAPDRPDRPEELDKLIHGYGRLGATDQ